MLSAYIAKYEIFGAYTSLNAFLQVKVDIKTSLSHVLVSTIALLTCTVP